MGARLLIDDALSNAKQCVVNGEVLVPVLLFGEYEWNQRDSPLETPLDLMSFDERLKYEDGREWWKDEHTVLPPSGIVRSKNWKEAVEWIKANMNPQGALSD
jgi:hypothetical protein